MRKIKNKRALYAVACLLVVVGTVAAIAFSNTLTGDIVLVSEYPIVLSWLDGGPYTDSAFCDVQYIATLLVENLDSQSYTLQLRLVMVGPVTAMVGDIDTKVKNDYLNWACNTGTYEAISLPFSVEAGITENLYFEHTFYMGAPLGTYALTIYAEIAP